MAREGQKANCPEGATNLWGTQERLFLRKVTSEWKPEGKL